MMHKNEVVQKQMKEVNAHLTDAIYAEQRRLEKAYNAGVEDGRRESFADGVETVELSTLEWEKEQEQAFSKGMDAAWNAARRIVKYPEDGGFDSRQLYDAFGFSEAAIILRNYTAKEAVERIAEYKKQKNNHVVTEKTESDAHLMTADDFENNPNVDENGYLPAWIERKFEFDRSNWTLVRNNMVLGACGTNHRYWSSKPTKEQAKAVPW